MCQILIQNELLLPCITIVSNTLNIATVHSLLTTPTGKIRFVQKKCNQPPVFSSLFSQLARARELDLCAQPSSCRCRPDLTAIRPKQHRKFNVRSYYYRTASCHLRLMSPRAAKVFDRSGSVLINWNNLLKTPKSSLRCKITGFLEVLGSNSGQNTPKRGGTCPFLKCAFGGTQFFS